MNEIVEYHNDFNKLSLGNFNELEQNLLMGILYNIKNKGDLEIKMDINEVMKFADKRKNITKRELLELVVNLRTNFFKLDFKVIKRQGTLRAEVYYNLFSKFEIWINENENIEKQKLEQEFSHLILKVNPDFVYIVNQLTERYTQYELEEFFYLRGKYAKNLYRLLKQFRVKGEYYATWQDFKDKMGIPQSFSVSMIEKQILKPCIEKLSEKFITELFDPRIPFENLTYSLKKDTSKRGKPQVTHIKFHFKPQEASCLDERQKAKNLENQNKPLAEPKEPHYITELKELCVKKAKIEKLNNFIFDNVYFNENEKKYYLIYRQDYKTDLGTTHKGHLLNDVINYEKAQELLKAYQTEQTNARKN